jgi:osmotically-inducible protein OsmY
MRFRKSLMAAAFSALLLVGQGKPEDDKIYDAVRMKIAADRDVGGNAVEVEVKDGAVVLKGKVQKESQRTKVERLVKKVKGVKTVTNQLTVETH